MRISRRSVGAVFMALLLLVALAPSAFAASEDSFLAKLNAERTSRGLAALQSHWDLVDDAEAHSHAMMDTGNLHHNPNLGSVTTGWVALGENVGVGPSVNSIHTSFMNSSGHRANILGDFTHVGIGAVRESENKLWVTVVFMKARDAGTTTTPSAPTTTGAHPSSGTASPASTTTTTTAPVSTTQAPVVTATTTPPVTTQAVGSVSLDEAPLKPVRLHVPMPI